MEKVVVDVGTGFYVEKSKDDAKDFYERKVAGLGENLGRLEGVVRAKEDGLRSVEEGKFCLLSIQFEHVETNARLTCMQCYGRRYYRLIADRRRRAPVRLLRRREDEGENSENLTFGDALYTLQSGYDRNTHLESAGNSSSEDTGKGSL